MNRHAILNVVGLCDAVIGQHTPRIQNYIAKSRRLHISPSLPAVTCTAQSDYLTGLRPAAHGIVANGWYNRELAEVHFWKQSNHVVTAPKVWDVLKARNPGFTCAKLFWWYNIYSTADYSITPRPMYPADGRKVFDVYSSPYSIRPEVKSALGEFPFPTFWGPAAGVETPQGSPDAASQWIAQSAKWTETKYKPSLSLVYLPHLDYNLQRLGPNHPDIHKDYQRIDSIVGDLLDFYSREGVEVTLLSEYGINAVSRPIHLNRLFRQKGWLKIKEEMGLELLDCGASKVFAVADHQVAHVYVNDRSVLNEVQAILEQVPGMETVLDSQGLKVHDLDHIRSGDFLAIASEDAWFTYYYWQEDARAPDFARCVDIHRKPGYDPVELFLNPEIPAVKLRIIWKLLQKKLGFRMLMDVIPLDATLVKGSHGRHQVKNEYLPVLVPPPKRAQQQVSSTVVSTGIQNYILGLYQE